MKRWVCAVGVCWAAVFGASAVERFVCAGEQASLSPDGRRIVFQRLEKGHFGVYVRAWAGGAETRLSPEDADAIQPEWNVDGRLVWSEGHETKTAFAARHDATGWNLVEMDADGTRHVLTVGRHRLFSPTYGADGRVYFASEIVKPDGGSTDVYAGNRTGLGVLTGEGADWYRRVTVLKDSNTGIADVHFSFSEMIRAEVAGYGEPWRIVISPVDRPEARTLLTGKNMVAVSPAITRDGTRAAFAGCREDDAGWRIYVGDLRGVNAVFRRIARGGNPSFSPDGRQVVYDRDGQIYVIEVDAPALMEAPGDVAGSDDARPEVLDRKVVPGDPTGVFEKIALVDGSDFATVFDVETRAGVHQALEHVARTGADTMLWRTHSGAMPRYRSVCENPYRLDHPIDTRRLANCSPVHSWMKLWREGPDPLTLAFEECAKIPPFRTYGFHMLEEEAHWQFQYLGEWNLNHPQDWCRKADGTVQMYHSSFAFPEVREHRLDIVRELLERHPDVLYYDTMRNGGYTPSNDFVKPNLEAWARRHPGQPVPHGSSEKGWPNWVKLCGESQYHYLADVQRLIVAAGGKTRLIVNVEDLEEGGRTWTARGQGIDWRELLRCNLVDALAVTSIRADPIDPLASVERSVRDFLREVGGRCKVYLPILNYNFSERRPSYGQLARWADIDEATMVGRLLTLYDRYGADGVVMECVDYGNYSEAVCRAIRGYRRGDWIKVEAAAEAPTADMRSLTMRSACMNKNVPLTVLLPSDYARCNRRYPVVYLLHGAGNDERTYAVRPIRNLAEKYGMIVVSPYGGNTWWMDAPEVPCWKYETMITRELVPWVDAHFRTCVQREGRMIAGHSMGGQGACRIGFRHQDLFSRVGNVMGGVDIVSSPERADLQRILGKYVDYSQRWKDHSVQTEAAKLKDGDIGLITVVGDRDIFLEPNRALHALLEKNGVAHRYIERPGEHSRTFAYRAMKDVFRFFAEDNPSNPR